MGNLPVSRTETCVAGAPVNPNLINEIQDQFAGDRRTSFRRRMLPSPFFKAGPAAAPTLVANPQAGGAGVPVWQIPGISSVSWSIWFEPGEIISDLSFDIYGDGSSKIASQTFFSTDLTGTATSTMVAGFSSGVALPASWQTFRMSTAGGTMTPTTLAAGGVLMFQITSVVNATNLFFGGLDLYLSR